MGIVTPHASRSVCDYQVRLWCAALVCLLAASPPALVKGERAASSETSVSDQHYRIELNVNYRAASFTGRAAVRFRNATRSDLESIYFHLYPNVGLEEEAAAWLKVQRVRLEARELRFSLKSRGAVLKVELPVKLEPGRSLELTLDFTGSVPRVQREETSLLAHFLQEVSDAMSDERLPRDARDIFFAAEQAMLLGCFYPMLATRQVLSSDYSLAAGAGGIVFSDVADYEVVVRTDEPVMAIASAQGGLGQEAGRAAPPRPAAPGREHRFRGEQLRGFALVLGERFKAVEKRVGQVQVVSYFQEGDERLGRKTLEIAARAVEIFTAAFGLYPYPALQIIELPMPAGYSGIDFPGIVALARAYYIDFDDPQAARLPGLVREQADLIQAALEFTLAHGAAHQWWGGVIGSDPQRTPYLDEALASYSAAYYYEAAYGRAAGETAIEQQLRAPYHAYRMLGGADLEVEKPAKEFRSSLQYTAIVQGKGAMLFAALRQELGDERFFAALSYYYRTHRFQIVTPDHLRYAFLAGANDPRPVRQLFQRWIKEKRGDEDLGAPEIALLQPPSSKVRALGRIFARIGRTAARPF
jgi:hypothetical protein